MPYQDRKRQRRPLGFSSLGIRKTRIPGRAAIKFDIGLRVKTPQALRQN